MFGRILGFHSGKSEDWCLLDYCNPDDNVLIVDGSLLNDLIPVLYTCF